MSFRSVPGSNLGAATEEQDSTEGLFSPGYVFGVRELPIENDPGAADPPVDLPRGEPAQTYPAPIEEPSPIASTRQDGANSAWKFWPSGDSSVSIALPDGGDIRALWFPLVPVAINVTLGFAGGALMYSLTQAGGELVPIPKGTRLLTLSANGLAAKPDLFIFATGDVLPPNKTGITGTPLPISGATSPYDQMILSTPDLEYYWPLSDQSGALVAKDYGPLHSNSTPTGNTVFGAGSILGDNTTSAQFDGAKYTGIVLAGNPGGAPNGGFPMSLEFWFAWSGFDTDPGGNATRDMLISNSPAGPFWLAILKANSHLSIVNGAGADHDLGFPVSTGTPHYVCVTSPDGNTWNVYFDGNLVYTETGADLANLGGTWWLFGHNNTDDCGPIGFAAKVAFYGAVLTPAQVAARWAYKLS